MADPHWTSFVGMGTGVFGAIIGYISYRTATSLKSLDLRIETRCLEDELKAAIGQHEAINKQAKESRPRIASAQGFLRSGQMQKWQGEIDDREKRAEEVINQLDCLSLVYDGMSTKQLEDALVTLRQFKGRIDIIIQEYANDLAWDDEQRRQLRKDAMNRR